MWPRSDLTSLLGIPHPIIQAPMAGGITTPELVAAVSEAGALGSLGAAEQPAAELREAVRAVRARTQRPFAVNLFTYEPLPPRAEDVEGMRAHLAPFHAELGLPPPSAPQLAREPLEARLEVLLEERVPVFSFTFGMPPPEALRRLKTAGVRLIGTATSVEEGRALEAAGVDAVVAQGSEAGGHRGTFLQRAEDSLVGTLALVPQLVDALRVPVIAAGGIMDARGVVAALALGASGVQMGSVFIPCEESGASAAFKQALPSCADTATTLTRAFSGRLARGLRNRFMDEMGSRAIPPYPVQLALTQPMRSAAAKQGRSELLNSWAGQAAGLARPRPAAELVEELVRESAALMARLARNVTG